MTAPLVLSADDRALARAARLLREGGLVVLPTDTVYGLAAALDRPDALRRIYVAKGRPDTKTLPILLSNPERMALVAVVADPAVARFAAAFWPGPLTVALPARAGLPPEVLGPGDTVGVRVPDHPVARRLIEQAGGALAVTSANRSGGPATTTAAGAAGELGDEVDLVLDGGTAPGGTASTVVRFDAGWPRIVRQGPLGVAELEATWRAVRTVSP